MLKFKVLLTIKLLQLAANKRVKRLISKTENEKFSRSVIGKHKSAKRYLFRSIPIILCFIDRLKLVQIKYDRRSIEKYGLKIKFIAEIIYGLIIRTVQQLKRMAAPKENNSGIIPIFKETFTAFFPALRHWEEVSEQKQQK